MFTCSPRLVLISADFSDDEETSRITPKNQKEVVNHLLTPMTKTHPDDFMLSPHFPPKHAVVVSCLCFFCVKAFVSEVWIKISRCITWCLKFIGGMDFVGKVKGLWLGIHGKVPTEPSQNDLKWPESLTSVTNFIFRSLLCVLLLKKYDGVGNPSVQNNLFLYIRSYYRLRTSIFGALR